MIDLTSATLGPGKAHSSPEKFITRFRERSEGYGDVYHKYMSPELLGELKNSIYYSPEVEIAPLLKEIERSEGTAHHSTTISLYEEEVMNRANYGTRMALMSEFFDLFEKGIIEGYGETIEYWLSRKEELVTLNYKLKNGFGSTQKNQFIIFETKNIKGDKYDFEDKKIFNTMRDRFLNRIKHGIDPTSLSGSRI